MEAAAIAWLVQTTLATLLIDKLDEWIRQVGLADDIEKLKLEVRRVKVVVSAVKGGAIGNERLAKSLALLKERLYEADDVVDELDYYRLQQQVQADPSVLVPSNFVVQGVTSDEPEVMAVAERVNDMSRGDDDAQNNSVRKLRSAVWKHFEITRKVNGKPKAECRHCRKEFNCDTKMNGTSSMKKHLEKEHPETCTKKPPGAHPPNPSSTSELIVTGSSSMRRGKKRWSKAWEHFDDIDEENRGPIARCKYCLTEIKCGTKNGTSGMLAHNRKCKKKSALHNQPPNLSRTRDVIANVTPIVIGDPSSRKRMRGVEEPAQITSADTHTNWDKNELSSRIQNITSQLQNIRGEVGEVLKRHESDSPSSSHPSGGSPHPLKDNYDDLPYHLQQCFSYCSIFPNKYRFLGKDLVYIWISQGFVNCTNLSKRLEETGWEYLGYLVSRGFFQKVEEHQEEEADEEELPPGGQIWYSMCGPTHAFARMVSRTECATIDGLQWNKMLPTIHHLSILTDSAYMKDQHGNISRNEQFEEIFTNTVTSVSKLRTLLLLGQYDSSFFQLFQDRVQKARNLRLLQLSATTTGFISFQCDLATHAHLRYLKCEPQSDGLDGASPKKVTGLFHLQVLDVGSYNDLHMCDGINSLVSLRHLVAGKGAYSSVASIGSMTSLQELHDFTVEISCGFEITQLQFMNELVQLGVSQLNNVRTREEAYGARLRAKEHLQKLHLSWDGSGTSYEPFTERAREVLEGLEPHRDLKHLHISGYYGVTSPAWLASNISITTLQALHLEYCGQLQILPFLEKIPFLRKLKLSNLPKVKEVLVSSRTLEELVLVQMMKLQRCSCTFVEGMRSSLRTLQIEKCEALRTFDVFMNHREFMIEQRSWLPGLTKLIIRDCPRLQVLKPLPPSSTLHRLLISRVSTFPRMEGSSRETLHTLHIGSFAEADSFYYEYPSKFYNESYHEFSILDDKIVAFHNLTSLKSMIIFGLQNLMYISFCGLSQLVSLKSLEIYKCKNLFSSYILPEHDMPAANFNLFPSLESLSIKSCGIAGKCLSLMLRHAPRLEELILEECPYITTLLSIEEEENSAPNLIPDWEYLSSGNLHDALTALAQDGLLRVPLNLLSSLRRATFQDFPRLTFQGSKKGFSGFTSLEKLNIWGCPELLSSLVYKDGSHGWANGTWLLPGSLEELHIANYSQQTLRPCFPSDLTRLEKLWVWRSPGLESLQLCSCTALEELETGNCGSLTTLEGLQHLGSLRYLSLHNCPGLPPYFESVSRRRGDELCCRLERLDLSVTSVLTTSFCEHLTSLKLVELRELVLTSEQGGALVLLRSMQELGFYCCSDLVELPAGLHTLPSLKRLEILSCPGILRLPETGLPLSLEKLEILYCSKELADECMLLATSKLNVRIVR